MERKKTSPIWLMPKIDFENLVRNSCSCAEVLSYFGFSRTGNNWKTVKKRCNLENINITHFNGKCKKSKNKYLLLEILIEHSTYSRATLKKRVLKEKLLENKCYICGLKELWENKNIIMILDHKNGVYDDNRLENLRMVCPNCNSQLDTFAGRNTKYRKERNNCIDCGKIISRRSKRCMLCHNKRNRLPRNNRKIVWPSIENLIAEIKKTNRNQVAKQLGVSETAVRKMLKRYS